MNKKFLSVLLTAILIVSLLPAAAFAAEPAGLDNFAKVQTYADGKFIDVKADDWFEKNISSAYELNLMVGKTASFFDTESNLTVAEAMAIAARLHSIYYTGKAEFGPSTPWYQASADYCKANGIADPADYDMNKAVTRGEFAAIFAKALPADALEKVNTVQDDMIPDVKKADKFSAAVYQLYRAGILVGNDAKGTFAPDTCIKRSEAAAITTRMADPSLRQSIKLTKPRSDEGSYTPPTPTPTPTPTPECPYAHTGDLFYVIEVISSQRYRTAMYRYDASTGKFEPIGLSTFSGLPGDPVYQVGSWMHYDVPTSEINKCECNGDGTEIPVICTVTFDPNGKTADYLPDPLQLLSGGKAYNYSNVAASGYTFEGWYKEPSCENEWNFDDPVTSDITLYAGWAARTLTICFDKGGGTGGSDSVDVTYGEKMPDIEVPTKDGYTFAGYFDDGLTESQYYQADGTCDRNWDQGDTTAMTMYAHWDPASPSPTLTVTFNMNGLGTTPAAITAAAGTTISAPTAPTASGYTFGGWYKEAACTNAWDFANDTVTADTVLYAKWTSLFPVFSVSAAQKVEFTNGNLFWDGDSFEIPNSTFAYRQSWDSAYVDLFYFSATADVSYKENYSDPSATDADVLFTNADETTVDSNFTAASVEGLFRSLSKDEWEYLLNTRSVNGGTGEGNSYRRATVNNGYGDVYGLIIYPDGYTAQSSATTYTSTEWVAMEDAGCVFIPAAGFRDGSTISYSGAWGFVWTSSAFNEMQAYYILISDNVVEANNYNREAGYSIRLVKDVQ